ncbi:MAG TPA: hypothetical protein VG295_08855 [Solirubrobacteraceae bacterium]|nr:hypothetical protein [Solirubrobacteraceae bacterium]
MFGFAAAAVVLGSAAAVASASPPGTKALPYTASLSTTGQDMWGAGSAAAPSNLTDSWFDQSWNASASGGSTTDVSFDICDYLTDGLTSCNTDYGTYGATYNASTSGEIGLSDTVHGATGGSVGVNYPIGFGLTAPADDSFAPGDNVTITSSVPTVGNNAQISSSYPSFNDLSIDGKFRFHAGIGGELCVGSCTSGSVNLDIPTDGSTASGQIFDISASDLLLIQGLGLAHCFGIAETLLFGASSYPNSYCNNSGYVKFPNVSLGAPDITGTSISASGTDDYIVVPISAVAWAARIAELPPGTPNLTASFGGQTLSYTTLNEIFTTLITQHQTLGFNPTTQVALDFGQPVSYTVKHGGTVVQTGTGSTATYPLGDSITLPVSSALTVTPTVSLADASFTNHTWDSLTETGQVKALAFDVQLGSFSVSGVTLWPGVDVSAGPLFDTGAVPLGSLDLNDIANNTWQLGGFNHQTDGPFTLSPDPLPVMTTKTVAPVEGAPFNNQVVATFVDPDLSGVPGDYTASIDWGDGNTSAGTITQSGGMFSVSGSNTYAEEGNYNVNVTVQDTDTTNVHATAHSGAVVSDAVLSVTAQPTLTSVEGAPTASNLLVASFGDADPAGTAADYSATINWGDGNSDTGTVVSDGSGAFNVLAPPHTYAEEAGLPSYARTMSVVIKDAGGATITAHPPMTTSDAALHAGPAVTNDTLAGSGTPVLLWPGNYTGVVANFTDDDPAGAVPDYGATIHWGDGTSSAGTMLSNGHGGFSVTGTHAYANSAQGSEAVTVNISDAGGSTTVANTTTFSYGFPAGGGGFAIGDVTYRQLAPHYTGTVNFWGSQWWSNNVLTSGSGPASFKGYITNPPSAPAPPATCPAGGTFTSATGNSSVPPATVAPYMAALVTSHVYQSSSTINGGTVVHWVIVHTRSGYGPQPSQPGFGTVVATIC